MTGWRRAVCAALALPLIACGSVQHARTLDKPRPRRAPPTKLRVESYPLTPAKSRITATATAVAGSFDFTFERFSGELRLVPKRPEYSAVQLEIDMSSVVGSVDFVTDIVRDDFLHTSRYPTARFTSGAIRAVEPGWFNVAGQISLHGVQRWISVPARVEVHRRVARLITEFSLDRRQYGVISDTSVDGLVNDDVTVQFELEVNRRGSAVKQPAKDVADGRKAAPTDPSLP